MSNSKDQQEDKDAASLQADGAQGAPTEEFSAVHDAPADATQEIPVPASVDADATQAFVPAGDAGATQALDAAASAVGKHVDAVNDLTTQFSAPVAGKHFASSPSPSAADTASFEFVDDRKDMDLFMYEKTWGHRLLAGVSIAMFVIAIVLIIYCAGQLSSVSALAGVADYIVTIGFVLYGMGLMAGVVIIPPAVLGVFVSKHPKHASLAIVAAGIAFALDIMFVAYALATQAGAVTTVLLYALLLAFVPAVYCVAACKVRASYRNGKERHDDDVLGGESKDVAADTDKLAAVGSPKDADADAPADASDADYAVAVEAAPKDKGKHSR